jgi:predicted phosphodiesterase
MALDFKIQYVSDIHLEFFEENEEGEWNLDKFVKPVARYLALCGDIGNPMRRQYREFLAACSRVWKSVFIVSGNHEYYDYPSDQFGQSYTKEERDEEIARICDAYPNVYFLRRGVSHRVEEGVWMVGATLWTHIAAEEYYRTSVYMNDYKTIWKEKGKFFHPSDCDAEHQADKAWILREVERIRVEHPGEAVVVITHHLPSFDCIHPEYIGEKLNYCYASSSDECIRAPIIAWLFGHTHKSMRTYKGDIFLGVNPWGYRHEKNGERSYEAVFTAGSGKEAIEKNYELYQVDSESEASTPVATSTTSTEAVCVATDFGMEFI